MKDTVERTIWPDNWTEDQKKDGVQNENMFQQLIEQNNRLYEIHYEHDLTTNKLFIGRIASFIKKIIRSGLSFLIRPIIDDQNHWNASVTQSLNEMFNRLQQQSNENEQLRQTLQQQNNENEQLKQTLQQQYNEMQRDISNQFHSLYLLKKQFKNRISQEDEKDCEAKKIMEDSINESNFASEVYQDIDYFAFENYFRGSEEDIKERQKDYLKFFADKKKVIDLGCGRGEFLTLMKENGIPAIGVDIYKEYVEYGVEKGIKIVQGDAVEFLRRQETEGADGIFCAQLIEHLKTEQIISICNLAYEKLKPGGCICFETPNPCCLAIYTNSFYIDPSHIKPVHPETMKYYLKQAGFHDIQVIFTECSKVLNQLPLLRADQVENLEEFNAGIQLVSNLLFGSQDYAILAYK